MFNAEMIAFLGYFIILFFVALIFFFNGGNKNQEDYFLGGRSMGPWVTAMSAQASDMSAWLLMGLPGSIMAFGFGQMWIGIGLALGTAANWIFCAKRLRKFSKAAGDAITLPQYLSNRFATRSKALQIICAVIFLICFTVYVASAFVAGTSVFTMIFPGVSERTGMILCALIIIGYTFLGGFKAVCWTDFFQGLLMLAALLAVPIIVVATQNIDTSLLQNVYQYTDASGAVVTCDFGSGIFSASWKDIVSGLGWGLGYFGMPHILVRFMSIEKPSMIKKSATVAIVWVVLALGAACLVAYLGRIMVGEELLTQGLQKTVFMVMARKYFLPVFSGLLLAAIMAACISTADSQLLAAASSVSQDLLQGFFRIKLSVKAEMAVARLTVLGIALIGIVLAWDPDSSVFRVVSFAWAGFGAAFGPVTLFSLFWKRTNRQGATAGMIAGGVMVFVWKYLIAPKGGAWAIYELLPAFIVSAIVIVVVSLATAKPDEDTVKLFEEVNAMK